MARSRLSTTAIAVLGLIAMRPMTGYEITQNAQRSYRHLWPREDSVLYAQPRALEVLGLVTSASEAGIRRPRTRYTITDEGRRALAEWLSTPAVVPFDWEPAVRLTLADQGDHADLIATIGAMRDWAERGLREGLVQADAMAAGESPFPERLALNSMNTVLVADLLLAIYRWSTVALEQISTWKTPRDDGGNDQWREIFRAKAAEVRQALGEVAP